MKLNGRGGESLSSFDERLSYSQFYDYVRLREITDCGLKWKEKIC